MYDKRYSQNALPENDWLIKRDWLADLVLKELAVTASDVILDIGCDDGFIQERVALKAKEVWGIDVNSAAIAANRTSKALVMDAAAMTFEADSFDKIFSSHTIEHIKDLKTIFREINRVLRPGGRAFFIYPWELWRGMAHARGAWKMCRNPFLGFRFHVHRLTPKKVIDFAAGTGLAHVKSRLVFLRTPQWTSLFVKHS